MTYLHYPSRWCAFCPTLQDCKLSAQIATAAAAKKSKSLWAAFRGTTHAHSLCVATATRLLRSAPQLRHIAWTNRFVCTVIRVMLGAWGPLRLAKITRS